MASNESVDHLSKTAKENGGPNQNVISNKGYSPIVLRKNAEKLKERNEFEYIEMGVPNDGYDHIADETGKKSSIELNSFSKGIRLDFSRISDNRKIAANIDDDDYLTPTFKRPPVTPMIPVEPQYEDLSQVAATIRSQATTGATTMGLKLPKRKTNIIYEPSNNVEKKKRVTGDYTSIPSNVPCWIIFALFIIGALAAVAIILFFLLYTGAMEAKKNCDCSKTGTGKFYPISQFQIC